MGGLLVSSCLLRKKRWDFPFAKDASASLAGFMIALSLIAVVYIGFVALVQQDMKKLIAYSSIAHMGFVTLGFFIIWAILSNPANNGDLAGVSMGITGSIPIDRDSVLTPK